MAGTSAYPVEDVWSDLQIGLNDVYNRKPMNPARYMELYTHVFNFCTSSNSAFPSARRPLGNANNPNASDFMGAELYERLKLYIKDYVSQVLKNGLDVNGEDLLLFYTKNWAEYSFSSKVVDGIFSYINRHWIKREVEEGNKEIFRIYTLSLVIWKEHLFELLKDRISDAALDLIQKERNGETIQNALVKGVVDSFVELGSDQETESETREAQVVELAQLRVYRERFEKKFLDFSETFYAQESQSFMENNSLTDYMKRVDARLSEEQERCNLYLHNSTQSKLAQRVEKVLIENHLEQFQSEFGPLLESRRDDDLARMYKLCERVEHGLDNLRAALEAHITKEGVAAVSQVADTAATDAKLYVHTILNVHKRYMDLVEHAFKNEPGFMQALDKAATSFINKNEVTMKPSNQGTNANKSPELLAKYCDQLLRKSSKMPDEIELEGLLNEVMIVFKYIEDKDIFSKYYTKMFSKRLINEMSASEDAETNLINKLKQSCGFEYTNRMSKMINDVQISKTTCAEFRQKHSLDIDINILILSTGSWPNMNPATFNVPKKLETGMEKFKDYYNTKHNGRKLNWIFSNSRGELVCTAFGSKKYLTCTTAQMAVLMMYNDSYEYTVSAILEGLRMDKRTLAQTVQSLIKVDILSGKEPESSEYRDDSTVISLNKSYSNKKVKVDLSKMAMRTDTKQESEQVQKNVEEDRKSIISACIVRIMKTRKTLSHQNLMTEVLSQLSSRFKPKIDQVKRCIGQLIEKEYMRRKENEKDIYEYIS